MTYRDPLARRRTIADLIELQAEAVPHNALLRTENGKVQKLALRERGIDGATWDREEGDHGLRR
jgi:hypothetical protein